MLLTSCACLKKSTHRPDQIAFNAQNITQLNGTYRLESINSDSVSCNMDDLDWILLVNGNVENGDRLQLHWEEPNRLHVTLLKESTTIRKKVFRGRIRNGYLVLNRKIEFIPLIVFTMWRNRNARLGLLASGELTVDAKIWLFGLSGMLPIPIIDTEEVYDRRFVKSE